MTCLDPPRHPLRAPGYDRKQGGAYVNRRKKRRASAPPPLVAELLTRGAGSARRLAGVGQLVLILFHAGAAIGYGLVGAEFLRIFAAGRHAAAGWRRGRAL